MSNEKLERAKALVRIVELARELWLSKVEEFSCCAISKASSLLGYDFHGEEAMELRDRACEILKAPGNRALESYLMDNTGIGSFAAEERANKMRRAMWAKLLKSLRCTVRNLERSAK